MTDAPARTEQTTPAAPGARAAVPGHPAGPPAAARSARRSALRRWLLIGIPTVTIALSILAFLHGGRYVSTDDAYVKADILTVSTDVAGTVVEVGAGENEAVEAGHLLYRLDDGPSRVALAAAEAQLAATRDGIAVLRATYRQKLAEAAQADSELEFSRKELGRIAPLVKTNAATQSQVDAAERDVRVGEERARGLREQAAATLADLGGKADSDTDDHPRVRQAAAQCALARRDLEHTRVAAPTAGIATRIDSLRPGLYLAAAAPALALVETTDVWVEASLKETDLQRVRAGQPARISVDAYPGTAWRGAVASISPAAGSQFALIPAQNASGNWVKVVQRIPVRISLPRSPDAPPLRAGMSVNVSIDTGYRRTLGDLCRSIGGWFGAGG